jgi:hypothetical protein
MIFDTLKTHFSVNQNLTGLLCTLFASFCHAEELRATTKILAINFGLTFTLLRACPNEILLGVLYFFLFTLTAHHKYQKRYLVQEIYGLAVRA